MPRDWSDAQLDRLTERVDRIEKDRRREKERALDRWMYAMLALVWIAVIATIVVSAIAAGSA